MLAALAGLALAGCELAIGPLPLPVTEFSNDCRGVGLDATLTGSPNDARLTWLVTDREGRIELVWPRGYTARFAPKLEVINESGLVVFREGDAINGGCVKGPADDPSQVLMIELGAPPGV